MKKVSDKQAAKLRHYNKVKLELEKELKESGDWVCIFSGIPIPDYMTWKEVSFHHLKGRDGDLITDKKFLRPCADNYHTGEEGFHNNPIYDKDYPEKSLCKKWWWDGFMTRVKNIDEDLWYSLKIKEK